MKAYYKGELVREGHIMSMVTGYRADTLVIEPKDIRAIHRMIDGGEIDRLKKWMIQLEARFPDCRCPT